MHDIKFIENNVEEYKSNLKNQNFDSTCVDSVLNLNKERKSLTTQLETLQSKVKSLSKEVGMKKKAGEDASAIMKEVSEIKSSMEKDQEVLESVKKKLNFELSCIPNLTGEKTPIGKMEDENKEVRMWGEPRSFNFEVKDHVSLGENLGMLDFEAAAKITGARFCVYKGLLARLERAIANYMIDFHLDRNYEEIIPPFIVHERSMYGTGNLPKFVDDAFKIENQDWYLIPTAEVPVTNLKRDEIFDESEFPLKYVAFTPCFRSEAGSHGRDTRGLIRMHQFNKVEMVNITHPDHSRTVHAEMIKSGQDILEELELPYRSVQLCSGDIGFGAKETIDLEVWVPSQEKYREISSISNCGDFQARRANIRFKKGTDKPQFAHTLNGSGLAVGRTLVAILENYQNEDGTINVPKKLIPYMRGVEIIK